MTTRTLKKFLGCWLATGMITTGAVAYDDCGEWSYFRETAGRTSAINCPTDSWTGSANCATYADTTFIVYIDGDINNCFKVESCASCPSGYQLQAKTGYAVGDFCDSETWNSHTELDLYECVKSCGTCTNCEWDTDWSAGNTGYQKRNLRQCDCGVCKDDWVYRCAPGYYGTANSASTGCTRCPSYKNSAGTTLYGTSTPSNFLSISDCMIPNNTACKDTAGTYKVTGCSGTTGTGDSCN